MLYIAKKMNGAEVQLQRLSSQEKTLFHRAKMKEVDSFLKNQAVLMIKNFVEQLAVAALSKQDGYSPGNSLLRLDI